MTSTVISTVLDRFLAQAQAHPQTIAVIGKHRTWTYAELDQHSDTVAARLIAQGVRSGDLVPLLADRSPETIAGLLGIVKAGAAYAPVDRSYPVQRQQYIIEQTGSTVVLAATTSAVIEGHDCTVVADLIATPLQAPLSKLTPAQAVYVIFTSGTTGFPKGVVIEHASLDNLIAWHNREFAVDAQSRLTQVAKIGFDVSQWEIWSALCAGAQLHLLDDLTRIDARALCEHFASHAVTHAFVPTVMIAEVVKASASIPIPLRYLFTAGEKLNRVDTDRVTYALVDYYGPTEATIFATAHRVPSASLGLPSSIGRPVAGAEVRILDDALTELPNGEPGELCIAGPGVARGYWNNDALTREKFIAHDGRRFYRTGDLARYLPDGTLQFLGRMDDQIKIRGNRVELAEIESQIERVAGIKKAAVAATSPDDPSRKEIIAFLIHEDTGHDAGSNLVARVKDALNRVLPDYMRPADYLLVESFPLTPNGKTDKKALLQRHADRLAAAPKQPERRRYGKATLMGIFSDVLGHGAFDLDDNFFEIGGHSLLAAQLIMDISEATGIKAYIRDIYEHPTVNRLYAELQRRADASTPDIDGEPIRALQNDIHLPDTLALRRDYQPTQITAPKHALLTGVTGFVGAHLAQELLATSEAILYCPIRARDQAHAQERFAQTMHRYDIRLAPQELDRIRVYAADLAKSSFGLPEAEYRFLCETVDLVYHSASAVNFIQPYSYMRRDNVQGLREVIGFAATGKLKPLILLSTISVYSWGHLHTGKNVMREDDDIDQNLPAVVTDIGYVRSKWVMEKIADLAAARGLPLMTFRLGYATFHSKTGVCADYQWWSRLVKTCLQFGNMPDLHNLLEGLTTVDYMTRAIAHISRNPAALGKKFNLIHSGENNLTLQEFFQKLTDEFGFAFERLPYAQWRAQWENDSHAHLYPLLSLFKDVMYGGQSTVELYQDTYRWQCDNVKAFLSGSGIAEPVFDRDSLHRYLVRSIGVDDEILRRAVTP